MIPPFLMLFVHQALGFFRERFAAWKRLVMACASVLPLAIAFAAGGGGRGAFTGLMVMNAFWIVWLCLRTFSSAYSEHRESGTFDLLRLTAASPLSILLGVGVSKWARTVLLLSVQIPAAAACIVGGGISPGFIMAGYTYAAAVIFFVSSVCVCCSAASAKSEDAQKRASLILLTAAITPFLPSFPPWVMISAPAALTATLDTLAGLHPLKSFGGMMRGGGFPWLSAAAHVATGAGFYAAAMWLAEWNTRGGDVPQPTAITPRARGRKRPRCEMHPVLWAEFHFAAGGVRTLRDRWILAGLLILLAIGASSGGIAQAQTAGQFMLVVGIWAFGLDVIYTSAALFGREVREGTLPSLIVTPESVWRITSEKARGHLPKLAPSLLVIMTGGAMLAFDAPSWNFRMDSAALPVLAGVYVILQMAIALLATMFLSLTETKSATSTPFLLGAINALGALLFHDFAGIPIGLLLAIGSAASIQAIRVLVRKFPESVGIAAARI